MSTNTNPTPHAFGVAALRLLLADLWCGVLNPPGAVAASLRTSGSAGGAGADELDFFALGGDSLSAGQLLHQIHSLSVEKVDAAASAVHTAAASCGGASSSGSPS